MFPINKRQAWIKRHSRLSKRFLNCNVPVKTTTLRNFFTFIKKYFFPILLHYILQATFTKKFFFFQRLIKYSPCKTNLSPGFFVEQRSRQGWQAFGMAEQFFPAGGTKHKSLTSLSTSFLRVWMEQMPFDLHVYRHSSFKSFSFKSSFSSS